MSVAYNVKVDIDTSAADQKVANITRQIAAIGAANGGGAPGLTSLNAQLQQIVATNPSVAAVIRSLGTTTQSATAAARGLQGVGTAATTTSTSFGTLGQSVAAANSRLGSLNRSLGSLALAGASTAILGAAGAFAFSVKAASDYADKLSQITTLIDTTTFNMSALNEGLKEQAVIYGQSPIAQAGAAYEIISSGAATAADAIATLNAANLLAAVGATNVGVAANGLTSVINAFASQALTATQAADSLFITVRDGKISMEQLSGSIGNVAPLAATLGLSLDDVGASIAALTLGGVQGSEAITNIRAALTAVIKPSSEASKLAKQIGLDFSSSALKAKGWSKFLDDIKAKTHGSVDQLAVLMGGTEGLSAVLALTTTGNAAFNASLDHMKNKAGVAADALKKVQDASPGFQMGRVMAAIKVEAIGLGESFMSVLVPSLKFIADNFHSAVVAVEALGTAFVVFKAISIASTMMQGATALGMLAKAASGLNMIVKAATATQALFNAVVLANPLTFLAAAVAGIVVLLYNFRDSIKLGSDSVATLGDLFRAAWETMGPIVSGVVDTIKSGFATAYSAVSGFLDGVMSVGRAIGSPFVLAMDLIKSLFVSGFGDLDFSIAGILTGAARTVDGLVGLFRGGWAAIVALWTGLPAAIGPSFQSFLTSAKAVVMAIGSGIASAYNAVVGFGASCASAVAAVFNSISGFIEKWTNKAIAGINTVMAGANKLGANLGQISEVKLGTIAAPKAAPTGFAKLGQSMGAAFAGGFGHEAENGVKGLLARAGQIGRGRTRAGAGTGTPAAAISLGAGGGGLPAKADKDKKDKVDPEIKKLEDRLKKEREYFQALDATAALAAMMPQDAERYNKELDLRKIRGDGELKDAIQLSNAEKERIANALKLRDTNELIRNIRVASLASDLEASHIAAKIAATAGVSAKQAAENLAVEEKLWPFKEDAMKKGISLADAELQKQLAILDAKERQNYQAERSNQLAQEAISNGADYGKGAIAEYGTKAAKVALATTIHKTALANLNAAKNDGKLDIDGFNAGVKKAGDEFEKTINAAADHWANKLGGVLNQLGGMIGGKVGEVLDGAGNIANSFGSFKDTSKDVAKSMEGVLGDGALAKGIGKATGNAMAGLKIGESVQQLSKTIGVKLNATGTKIGGAIGGLTGNPLIAAAGSLVGGLLGNLFSKPKEASANFSVLDGKAMAGVATGHGSKEKGTALALSGNVADGLNSIAVQLGGSIGSLSGVSVGYRPGHKAGAYRVDTSGGGKLTGNTVAAFEDEAEAIAFAIKNAISDGAITGLKPTIQKALKALGADAAIAFAQSWASAMDDYDSILDPIAASIKAINAPIDALKATLVSIGDTSADQSKLEEYRQAKLAQVMKSQTKTFSDLLESLNDEGMGITALSRFTTDMAKFSTFQTDIKAGKQVDQDAFASLVNKLMTESNAINGTSTAQAEAVRQMLIDATTAAQQLVMNEFNNGSTNAASNDNTKTDTTSAITNGTTVVKAGIDATNVAMAINNSYQSQIFEELQKLNASGGGKVTAMNSRAAQV